MCYVPGRTFLMGSDRHYPEEGPTRAVCVDGFWMDETPVTNGQFAAFVAATGHVTTAELPPDPVLYPDLPGERRVPASAVFVPCTREIAVRAPMSWWQLLPGADWQHPYGRGSSIAGLETHPVVHVTLADAEAYARWAGKDLPTEAEWELAARSGLDGAAYAWGEELAPGGVILANYWHGRFPWENLAPCGFTRTSPVYAFPPNGYGLRDMIGNVWEWTSDWYRTGVRHESPDSCCTAHNSTCESQRGDPASPSLRIARKTIKGGSHLCAWNYCRRYRPAARCPQNIDTSTSHLGFRCIIRRGTSRSTA
jgi:formylglycine-generating enzyme required for sulfatase activity